MGIQNMIYSLRKSDCTVMCTICRVFKGKVFNLRGIIVMGIQNLGIQNHGDTKSGDSKSWGYKIWVFKIRGFKIWVFKIRGFKIWGFKIMGIQNLGIQWECANCLDHLQYSVKSKNLGFLKNILLFFQFSMCQKLAFSSF